MLSVFIIIILSQWNILYGCSSQRLRRPDDTNNTIIITIVGFKKNIIFRYVSELIHNHLLLHRI